MSYSYLLDSSVLILLLRQDPKIVQHVADAIYGRLKHEQRMKGLMIPDNDLWIAATAMQYSLTLATRDLHFNWITGLTLEQW